MKEGDIFTLILDMKISNTFYIISEDQQIVNYFLLDKNQSSYIFGCSPTYTNVEFTLI